MFTDRYLQVDLLDKNFLWQGRLGGFTYVTVTERFNALSTGELAVAATNPKLPILMAPGCRVVVTLRAGGNMDGGPTDDGLSVGEIISQMMSGVIRDPSGSLMPNGTVTFQLMDDWRYTQNLQALVRPGHPLEAQSLSDAGQAWDGATSPVIGEDTDRTGYWPWGNGAGIPSSYAAEDAVIDFLAVHLNQRIRAILGPLSPEQDAWFGTPPSLHRGGDVTAILPQVRFGGLDSWIVPLLTAGGLGLRFTMNGYMGGQGGENPFRYAYPGWEIFEPRAWPFQFTPDSGVVTDGTFSLKYPTASRAIAGGPGEASARAFTEILDTSGIEAEYRDVFEVFRDATGAPMEWPTGLDAAYQVAKYFPLRTDVDPTKRAAFLTNLQNAGADALSEGVATSGVDVKLSESKGFFFNGRRQADWDGKGFATGDLLEIAPSQATGLKGVTFAERITATTVTFNVDDGLTVTPQVGQVVPDTDVQTALAVRRLADLMRKSNTSR